MRIIRPQVDVAPGGPSGPPVLARPITPRTAAVARGAGGLSGTARSDFRGNFAISPPFPHARAPFESTAHAIFGGINYLILLNIVASSCSTPPPPLAFSRAPGSPRPGKLACRGPALHIQSAGRWRQRHRPHCRERARAGRGVRAGAASTVPGDARAEAHGTADFSPWSRRRHNELGPLVAPAAREVNWRAARRRERVGHRSPCHSNENGWGS